MEWQKLHIYSVCRHNLCKMLIVFNVLHLLYSQTYFLISILNKQYIHIYVTLSSDDTL